MPSRLDVSRQPIVECRILGNGRNQIIPSTKVLQLHFVFQALPRLKVPRPRLPAMGVQYRNIGCTRAEVRNRQLDRAAVLPEQGLLETYAL